MPARLALVDGGEARISEVTVLFFLLTNVTGNPPGLHGQGETRGVLASVATSPDPLRESQDARSFGNRELNSAWGPSHSAPRRAQASSRLQNPYLSLCFIIKVTGYDSECPQAFSRPSSTTSQWSCSWAR